MFVVAVLSQGFDRFVVHHPLDVGQPAQRMLVMQVHAGAAALGAHQVHLLVRVVEYPLHEAHIPSDYLKPDAALPISFWSQSAMMRPDSKVEKVYLYPKPVDFRKSIDGLTALVELDIKVAVFDPVLFVFLNKARNRIKVLYWERNGFCLWLKRLEAERFKTSPDASDEAIVLTVQELNWLLDGFDLWRNRPHQVLTPRFVA
ncbi:IS66 Orf2 like protein [compost metagenome]